MAKQKDIKVTAVAGTDFDARVRKLRWWNVSVGLVLAAQAVVIAVLANDFSLPVMKRSFRSADAGARKRGGASISRNLHSLSGTGQTVITGI